MPLKYAAFTVMTPEFTLEETVAILKQLGYDGIEWRVHNVHSDFADKPDYWRSNRATVDINTIVEKAGEIRKLTEDHGLEILGLGHVPQLQVTGRCGALHGSREDNGDRLCSRVSSRIRRLPEL